MNSVICKCGRKHQHGGIWITQSGISHGCRFAAQMDLDAAIRSAKNIAEKAREAREEAEALLARAARGRMVERSLAKAQALFEAIHELEEGDSDIALAIDAVLAAGR